MTKDGARVTVLLVQNQRLVREGLRRAVDLAHDLDVVREVGSVAEAVAALEELSPDVLVTDVRLPDGDGIALARQARAGTAELGIVVLTMISSDRRLFAARDAGASAFVVKDAPVEEVLAAIRHAAASPGLFLARDLADAMRRARGAVGPRLTRREGRVLELLVDGLVISQIARRLVMHESTAKTHVANLYEKLGGRNRTEVVAAAVRLGLIGDEGGGAAVPAWPTPTPPTLPPGAMALELPVPPAAGREDD